MYLVLSVNNEYDNVHISQDEEKKIRGLIKLNRLPKKFVIDGQEILSDTILGFSDKHINIKRPDIHSMQELSSWVRSQPWYQKHQGPDSP